MKEITQYLSEDTSVYATALAAAKADYQHAVSVVAHEFYTQRNGVSIDAQELRALSNVIETAVAHPARFARRLRKLQRSRHADNPLLRRLMLSHTPMYPLTHDASSFLFESTPFTSKFGFSDKRNRKTPFVNP